MKRIMLLLSLFIAACATAPQRSQDLVNRALDAMGGADALAQVKTIAMKATVKHWEPEQSAVADGEMRFAAEATVELTGDFATHTMRIDWVKNFAYPAPRTFRYSEIVTPQAGYVLGVDSNGRNRQSLANNPPAHAMSGLRLAATLRELRRASPSLLLEMRNNPDRVQSVGEINAGGASYPAASYNAGATPSSSCSIRRQTCRRVSAPPTTTTCGAMSTTTSCCRIGRQWAASASRRRRSMN